jgi:hypothetical protein
MKFGPYFMLCAVLIILIFTNCSKNSDTPAANYSPTTEGSSWTYVSGTNIFRLTATNRDTVAAGKTYKVLTNSNGPNNYVAKVGNDYYRFAAVAAIGSNGVEELYLKDNQDVNATWSTRQNFTAPGFGQLTADLKYTIKSKGASRVVSGKTYNNVIQVRSDISVQTLSVGGGDFYYAEGIGLIESNIAIAVPGLTNISEVQSLTAYEIK